ncbi:MAG: hypothetical protein ABSE69_05055 [Roseiarcus sp.]
MTMPERSARIMNTQSGNQSLPFLLNVPVFDAYLYWRPNAGDDPANAWLWQQLLHTLEDRTAFTRRIRRANQAA